MSSHPESFNFETCEAKIDYQTNNREPLTEHVLFTCRHCHIESTARGTNKEDLVGGVAEVMLKFCRRLK